jgi:hypothetical protein
VHSASAERVSGNPTSLIGTFGEEPWLVMEVSSRSPEYRREVRLHCRDGVAVLNDGYSKHLQIARTSSRGAPDIELRPISEELPLLRELRAFIEYLEGGPPPRSSAAEGALIVNTIAELRVLAGITGKQAVYPQLRGQTS